LQVLKELSVVTLLLRLDLVEQVGQRLRIADVVSSELRHSDFQNLLVNPCVDLAPNERYGEAPLAGVPLVFPLNLKPGTVDQRCKGAYEPRRGKVTFEASCRRLRVMKFGTSQSMQLNRKRLSTHPVVWRTAKPNRPGVPVVLETDLQAHFNLHCQAGLDRGIAAVGLSATLANRSGLPSHGWNKPDH
jgi:hypothetical protein